MAAGIMLYGRVSADPILVDFAAQTVAAPISPH
jgi:hypothetical protein